MTEIRTGGSYVIDPVTGERRRVRPAPPPEAAREAGPEAVDTIQAADTVATDAGGRATRAGARKTSLGAAPAAAPAEES